MSTENQEQIWETYVASWKATEGNEKLALFEKCLEQNCEYHDPLTKVQGWEALKAYMLDFQKQLPGGHFVTTKFQSHGNKCITTWDMRTGDNQTISEGISYGEYNTDGKLKAMTGFFELPEF